MDPPSPPNADTALLSQPTYGTVGPLEIIIPDPQSDPQKAVLQPEPLTKGQQAVLAVLFLGSFVLTSPFVNVGHAMPLLGSHWTDDDDNWDDDEHLCRMKMFDHEHHHTR